VTVITKEILYSLEKEDLSDVAKELNSDDIAVLVEWLSEKDDKLRYQSLLLLQNRSMGSEDVYPYWEVFRDKLKSENSYHRSIGIMMIAGNVKWDKKNQFEELFEEFFSCLKDEKPITVRQFIQSLKDIVPYTMNLGQRIAEELMSVDLLQVKETMRKLVLQDILEILILIREYQKADNLDHYITEALMGSILDKKAKKYIEGLL